MGGWDGWEATKWQEKATLILKTDKWHPSVPFFTSICHTKQLSLWPNSSAILWLIYSWLSACQEEMEQFKDHPSTRGHLTSLRNKSSLDKFQHQYLPQLLVIVYSYRLMVKSMSCCYVCGRWALSDSVTIMLCLL